MGLFDSYSGSLKTLRDGRAAFYPRLFGRGYVVSPEQGAILSRYASRAMKLELGLLIIASAFGVIAIFVVGLLYLPGYYGGLWWLTRNLERTSTDERLMPSEYYSSRAQQIGATTLWLMEIGCALFILAGLYMAVSGRDRYSVLVGLSVILLFGFAGCVAAYMIWVKDDRRS